jgi:RND family efflux transporter MFP subunit
LTDEDVSPVERIAADRAETEQGAAFEAAEADREAARLHAAAAALNVDLLRARIQRTEAEREQAIIDLARTQVVSPIDGIVLERHAAPGMKRMMGMDDMDSATIVTLYDPARLQVRVDVPLSDVGRIDTGTTARIVTAAFPNQSFTGIVTRITGEADITRNTLQVKVAIRNPDPRMRPNMLCRAEFIGSITPAGGRMAGGNRTLWIPAGAIVSEQDGSAKVWVVDPVEETAHPRDIIPGKDQRNGLRLVQGGLRPGERIVVHGADRLKPGARVALRKGDSK